MARNAIVYQSRNRLTGTLTQTIDTMHKDSPLPYNARKGRYAARCVEHNATVFFTEHYPAGRAIAHVDEWCKRCITMIAAGKKLVNKARMNASAGNKLPDVDKRQSTAETHDGKKVVLSAYDKRWSNGKSKRNPKREKQRKIDQENMHDIDARSIAITETIPVGAATE